MNCAFCHQDSRQIGWDETSHLGKRPICYTCIGDRDVQKMHKYGTIVLYVANNKLANQCKTIFFSIKNTIMCNTHTVYIFIVNKKRWRGIKYNGCDRVICRKQSNGIRSME